MLWIKKILKLAKENELLILIKAQEFDNFLDFEDYLMNRKR